jgi:glycosyltransferase involved in cell wall biosynthesis
MKETHGNGIRRVLVLSDDISEEGGIRSRVLGELSTIGGGDRVIIVARIRARNLILSRKLRADLRAEFPDVRLYLTPVLPHGGFVLLRELGMALGVLMLSAAGLRAHSSRRITSIYAHNAECVLAGLILGRVLNVPVSADIHGDEVEENVTLNRWRRDGLRHRFWRWLEGIAVRRPNLTVCVSNAHKEYLLGEYRRREPVAVIPCCVDEKTIASPSDLRDRVLSTGLPDAQGPWLLYSGSCSKYQMLDTMRAFHQSVLGSGMHANVLLLISDPGCIPGVKKMFGESPMGRVVAMSVPHADVPRRSMGANAAMLFREDVPLNRISSPTKFAEYLASGLPVIITPSVGDYSRIVSENGLGQVIDLAHVGDPVYAAEVVNRIISDGSARQRCLEYARAHLTWSSYRAALLDAYGLGAASGD